MIYRPNEQAPLFEQPQPHKHTAHTVHRNSVEAYRALEHAHRYHEIRAAMLAAGRPMTDREVMTALGKADMNYVRPTITHAIDDGLFREVGHCKCPVTGRTVRKVEVATTAREQTQ